MSPTPVSPGLDSIQPAGNLALLETESAFQVLARAAVLKAQGRDIIDLGIGQPDFPTPPHIVEAGVRAMRDGHHGYTPPAGLPALRDAVADDLMRRYSVDVEPARVIIVPGGKVTMFFACMAFGAPGTEILYPDPGFPIYRSAAAYTGARPVPYPLRAGDDFAIDPEAVLRQITPATRLLIVNSPSNPTGGVTPTATMDRLAEGLARYPHVAILSDEIYSRLVYGDRKHASLLAYPHLAERLVLLDGWSKAYAMTGWRLGYGVWPHRLAEAAERLCVNCHSCVNAPSQHAAIAALNGPQDAVTNMIAAFARRRRAMWSRLSRMAGVRCAEPTGAFYCFPGVHDTGLTARTVERGLLEEAGVATIAGTSFGKRGEGFVRLSHANSDENLARALDRIEAWIGANHRHPRSA